MALVPDGSTKNISRSASFGWVMLSVTCIISVETTVIPPAPESVMLDETPVVLLSGMLRFRFDPDELEIVCCVNVPAELVAVNTELLFKQMVAGEGVTLMDGAGFTVTVAVIEFPTQEVGEGPVGVIVKVTVTAEVVVLVNVTPVMLEPEPLEAMPVTEEVLFLDHAKVVPVILLLVLSAIVVNAEPEHMVWLLLVAVASGKAFTLTLRVLLTAGQAPGALLVKVKVAVPLKLAAGV